MDYTAATVDELIALLTAHGKRVSVTCSGPYRLALYFPGVDDNLALAYFARPHETFKEAISQLHVRAVEHNIIQD
jgi:hypothetical protein